MKNSLQKVYKYHFKMDTEMFGKLEKNPLYKKLGNLSKLINKVLMMLSPGIEKKHLQNEQMMSKYLVVNDNMELERKNVFVYMPEHCYRQLKLLHQDLNFYSIAQLLRLFLGVFLDFSAKYGDEVESKLMALYLQWKAKRKSRKYEWKPVEELLHFIYQKSKISWFLTLYSKKFQPISIYRL